MSSKRSNPHCLFCKYDRTGLNESTECPECGHVPNDADKLIDVKYLARFSVALYILSFLMSFAALVPLTLRLAESSSLSASSILTWLFVFGNAAWALFGAIRMQTRNRTVRSANEREFDLLGTLAAVQLLLLPWSCCCLFVLGERT